MGCRTSQRNYKYRIESKVWSPKTLGQRQLLRCSLSAKWIYTTQA
jgi:hypothetical protein